MLLRRVSFLAHRAARLCSLPPRSVLVESCLGSDRFSARFELRDELGTKEHCLGSTASNRWAKFQAKIAAAVSFARRKKVQKAIRKGDFSLPAPEDVVVELLSAEGRPLGEETSLHEAFQDGCILRVGPQSFRVVRNAPAVSGLRLPRTLLRGCPIFLAFRPEFCERADCKVTWFTRSKWSAEAPPPQANWDLVHHGPVLQLSAEQHVGSWVKARVVPRDAESGREGLAREEVASEPLREGPALTSPIRHRHEVTKQPAGPGELRVVSYNLLADFYADSDYSRNQLFPYCPPQYLDFQYRRQVLLWELSGYNADVLCLQEVDKTFFEDVLQPFFAPQGFSALFLPKWGLSREGLVVLFRRSKLVLLEDVSLPQLSAALPQLAPHLGSPDLSRSPAFAERWADRNNCLLALLFRSERGLVLLGTTHLYAFPSAANVRLLQAALCLKHLELQREIAAARGTQRCAVLFTGDLNSEPRSAVFSLATEGQLPAAPRDWFSAGRPEFFGCPEIRHDLRLRSTYGNEGVTNFVPSFCGMLDYIFFDSKELSLSRAVPLPSFRELQGFTALPNEFFPSDHLALVGDFAWRRIK